MPAPCLMLDTTMPEKSVAALSEIVTLIRPDASTDPALLAKIEVAVCSPIHGFNSAWFEKLPALKLIATFGVGLDRVDIAGAAARGITVTITRDVLTHDTADQAFALLLALTRQIIDGDKMIRAGRWAAGERLPHGISLRGKRLGIVGMGAIGQDIARKGEIFGMEVNYYNRRVKADLPWRYFA